MKYAVMHKNFIAEFCDRLTQDLELFAQMIEWEYPIEWGEDCEKVIEYLLKVKADENV